MFKTGNYHEEQEEIMQHWKFAWEPHKRSQIRIVGYGIDRPRANFFFLEKHEYMALLGQGKIIFVSFYFFFKCFILLFFFSFKFDLKYFDINFFRFKFKNKMK